MRTVDFSSLVQDYSGEYGHGAFDVSFGGSAIQNVDFSSLQRMSNFYSTFADCRSLEKISFPNLTTVGRNDEEGWGLNRTFADCTSLKVVEFPKLSTIRGGQGYDTWNYTFYNCPMLEKVDFSKATAIPRMQFSEHPFQDTNNTFKIVVPDALYGQWIAASGWCEQGIVEHIVKASEYAFYFVAEEANSTVSMATVGTAPSVSLEYSTDASTWSDFIVGTTTVTLTNVGDRVWLRAKTTNSTFATDDSNYNKFVMTGKIAASNSIMYLLKNDGDLSVIPSDDCFNSLFQGCTSLTKAPELPATTLDDNCYESMFWGCTSLISAPALPATTLAGRCYEGMFASCSSLTQAPELPATTLGEWCYEGMFDECTSLTKAPELPATTLATGCYANMFHGCTSLNEIFTLYKGDFSGDDVPTYAFSDWVSRVSSTGTFYYDGSDTTTGPSAIPQGWSKAITYRGLVMTAAQDANNPYWRTTKGNLETSRDGGVTWVDYSAGDRVYMQPGESVCIRAKTAQIMNEQIQISGKIGASGYAESIVTPDYLHMKTLPEDALRELFAWQSNLTSAPTLISERALRGSFTSMFYNCTNLSGDVEFPNLVTDENNSMATAFQNCTNLRKFSAPKLESIWNMYCTF